MRQRLLASKRDELQREEASLQRQIGEKEDSKAELLREVNDIKAKIARSKALLDDAESDLDDKIAEKCEAQRKRRSAEGKSAGGAVGATMLGIVFPVSLAVTIPAMKAAEEAGRDISRCEREISELRQSIIDQELRILLAIARIDDIQRCVSGLNARLRVLYEERGRLQNTTVFMQKAVTYFSELQVAVEGGRNRNELLRRIVVKANKKEDYRVLNSRGGINVVGSFAKAWEIVEDKVMSGDTDGFLGIEFIEIPQLR